MSNPHAEGCAAGRADAATIDNSPITASDISRLAIDVSDAALILARTVRRYGLGHIPCGLLDLENMLARLRKLDEQLDNS